MHSTGQSPTRQSFDGAPDVWSPAGPRNALPRPHYPATIVAMTVEPLRTVRDHLSEFVDRAEREHERVVVTRNGRPAAVLIGYDDLASLEETLDILSDPEALADVRQAEADVARGDVVRGADAIRALRPRP
jgi:antitoxin YefM